MYVTYIFFLTSYLVVIYSVPFQQDYKIILYKLSTTTSIYRSLKANGVQEGPKGIPLLATSGHMGNELPLAEERRGADAELHRRKSGSNSITIGNLNSKFGGVLIAT